MNLLIEWSEKLLKILGAVSVWVLALAYIDIYMFYNGFAINISEYISVSEIVILSLGNLIEAMVLLAIPFYLLIRILKRQQRVKATYNWKLKKKFAIKILLWDLFVLALAVTFMVLKWNVNFPKGYDTIINFLAKEFNLMFSVLSIGMVFYRDGERPYKLTNNPKFYIATLFALSYFIFLQAQTENKSRWEEIKDKPMRNSMYIKMSNGQPDLNFKDSLGYIGRTSNYIFIYNKNIQSSIVIPAGDVSQIIIRDGNADVAKKIGALPLTKINLDTFQIKKTDTTKRE